MNDAMILTRQCKNRECSYLFETALPFCRSGNERAPSTTVLNLSLHYDMAVIRVRNGFSSHPICPQCGTVQTQIMDMTITYTQLDRYADVLREQSERMYWSHGRFNGI